jgi:hypothetical protein
MVAAALVGSAVVGGVAANMAADTGAEAANNATAAAGTAADRQAAIAGRAQDLAETQYADQRAITAEYSPLYRQMIQQQIDASNTSTQRSNDAWADYNSTWRPVEQRLASDALAFASPGRQQQAAERASGDVATQFDQARAETTRSLQQSGADPSTIAALTSAGRLEEAKAKGGAADTARRATETQGMALLDNAARFGRNMPSTGLAAATLAGQQGQQGLSTVGGLQSLTAAPGAAAAPLLNTAIGANGSAGGLFLNSGQLGLNSGIAQSNALIGGMGAGLQVFGMSGGGTGTSGAWNGTNFSSSKKLKDIGGEIDGDEALDMAERSPSLAWAYKPGAGDGNTKHRMGPTAESLRDATGGVVSDGETVDGIAMLGLHHAAHGAASKRLKRIEKKLGLADARKKD